MGILDLAKQSFLSCARLYPTISPVFAQFCDAAKDDTDLISLAACASSGQPAAVLLFFAAQYLAFAERDVGLGDFSGDTPFLRQDLKFQHVRDFCVSRREKLSKLLSSRTVNTSCPSRANYIMPTMQYLWSVTRMPLAIVEIGCGAGFNLQFDKFFYDYHGARNIVVGDRGSAVHLECQIEGRLEDVLAGEVPPVSERIGLDLVQVSASDHDDRLWMAGMLFPEWASERRRLSLALDVLASNPVRWIVGDALITLGGVLRDLPGPITVLHSHCLYQWDRMATIALDELLIEASHDKAIYRIGVEDIMLAPQIMEMLASRAGVTARRPISAIRCIAYEGGKLEEVMLGLTDPFGSWLQWQDTT